MRYLPKEAGSPADACIQGFIDVQMGAREQGVSWEAVMVDYCSFTRTRQLRPLLIKEQKGLCAYTGVALDERLSKRRPNLLEPPRVDYWFKPHIEHMKSEKECREELVRNGGVVGRDVGEDMAYSNMAAAIDAAGTPSERFGASFRGDRPLPIIPTMPECESSFEYLESGRVVGRSDDAELTIANLDLDHATLVEWRRGAIRAFLAREGDMTDDELAVIARSDSEEVEQLEEFVFVVGPIARFILTKRQMSA